MTAHGLGDEQQHRARLPLAGYLLRLGRRAHKSEIGALCNAFDQMNVTRRLGLRQNLQKEDTWNGGNRQFWRPAKPVLITVILMLFCGEGAITKTELEELEYLFSE